MKLDVLYVGKARDVHSNGLVEEFVKRTGRWAQITVREISPDRYDPFARHPAAVKVMLDPAGKLWTTEQFVAHTRSWEDTGREVIFVLGGHDGLPAAWRDRADFLLSLSPMTFPHELARAMLLEQIYRAFATLRGHPYPR
ncbi:MAG: 23S rRNA (pseudouridine(1915)-N(3))-methyltransferase RlmH [Bryobacter sp.]|nr:23S rRNA (pseudouridine(1915)-N(3))-methyltransferase RlmH [Bryobacter sp.]